MMLPEKVMFWPVPQVVNLESVKIWAAPVRLNPSFTRLLMVPTVTSRVDPPPHSVIVFPETLAPKARGLFLNSSVPPVTVVPPV